MLDDLKYIHQRDSFDALGIAEKQWQQLGHDFPALNLSSKKYKNIVYAGMGGSALAADLSTSWPGYSIPFEICKQYHIPAYVSDETLIIAASYSGNTEETVSAITEAEKTGATITIIAGGGKLAEFAQAKGYPLLNLPKAAQPRYAVLYNLKALVHIVEALGQTADKNAVKTLEDSADFLKKAVEPWLPAVPASNNPAKKMAMEIAGKSPVIYAGPVLAPIAYKWKINFNENAKNVAWRGEYPEFNHNEFIGWSSHPINKPYSVIDLRSNLEHPQVQKRFEVSERLLSGKRPSPIVVNVQGQTVLQQLLWSMAFGDFVTIYLALINNVDPAPVGLVEKFKTELNK